MANNRVVIVNGRQFARNLVLDCATRVYPDMAGAKLWKHSAKLEVIQVEYSNTPEGVRVSLPGTAMPSVRVSYKTLTELLVSSRWFLREGKRPTKSRLEWRKGQFMGVLS